MKRNDLKSGKGVLFAAVMATGLGLACSDAMAVTHTWTGEGTGSNTNDWSAKQNWSTSSTPAAQDTALFKSVTGGSSTTPTIDATGQVVGIITFDSVGTAFTIAGSNALSLNNGASSAQINLTAANTANQVINAPLSLASNLAISNASGASLSIAGVISGSGMSLTKSGTGTVVLSGVNTYTGNTTITGGALNLTGSGSVANSATVNLNGGSLSSAATFTRGNGQKLMGQGSITGNVTMNTGSTLQVGQTHGTAGTASTLTVTGASVFSGSTTLSIDLFSASTADKFATTGALTLSGVLSISNASGFSFASGQSWDVIDWGSRTGTFTTVSLPVLNTGLSWNLSALYTTGVLSIDAAYTAGHYTLSASAAASRVISGGSTTITSTVTNTGTGTNDSVTYSGLTATDANATITGSAGGGTLAQTQNGNVSQTFSSTITGIHTVTPTATVNNTNLGGSATPDGTTSASVTVVAKRAVNGDTVNIGKIIGGTTVNTTASVSTTGDNNHYTGVQVAGSSSNSGNGLTASGSATNFTGTGSALRTISGAITGAGIVSGDLLMNVTTLENGGAGLTGEGSYAQVALHYTAEVLSHADGKFQLPVPNPDPSYPTDYNYNQTTADKSVSVDGKTVNVDFKTIWATPGADPYPVYAYIDISNIPANAAGLRLTGLTFTDLGHPSGTTQPNWFLQIWTGLAWSDLTTLNFTQLSAAAVAKLRVVFDSNDPSLYEPNTPFLAKWDLLFQDELSVAGGYYGSNPSLDSQYHLTINASATAIPLPVSAVMGTSLLGLLGLGQMARTRRLRRGD